MSDFRGTISFEPAATNLPDTLTLRGLTPGQIDAMVVELQALSAEMQPSGGWVNLGRHRPRPPRANPVEPKAP